MVEDLFKAFVKEDFVSEIDFSLLKRANNSYVTKDFKDREADILWQTKFKEKDAYIYILIEFQSTVDRFMSLRMLTYILLFYQDIIRKNKLEKLPVVFPILLYNGEKKWNAPVKIEELIEMPFKRLKPYIPKFKYYKIAENEFKKENLERLNNLAAQLFNIENSSIDELDDAIIKILSILKSEVSRELQRDFGLWIRKMLKIKDNNFDIEKLDEMEVKPMLAETLKRFEEEVVIRGRQEGIEKGIIKGMEKGMMKGIEKGITKGKIEERKELAKKLLGLGVDIKIISKASGMSEEEIKKLLN